MNSPTLFVRHIVKGSKTLQWNASRNGEPFGAVWTFRNTATETHRFHAKTLSGDYADFATLVAAKEWLAAR